jgi:hypothetical protein
MRVGDILIEMGYLDEAKLEYAISYQKGEVKPENTNQGGGIHQDILKKLNVNIDENKPKTKQLIGNVLIELRYINQEQLNLAINVQRWFRHLIENVR